MASSPKPQLGRPEDWLRTALPEKGMLYPGPGQGRLLKRTYIYDIEAECRRFNGDTRPVLPEVLQHVTNEMLELLLRHARDPDVPNGAEVPRSAVQPGSQNIAPMLVKSYVKMLMGARAAHLNAALEDSENVKRQSSETTNLLDELCHLWPQLGTSPPLLTPRRNVLAARPKPVLGYLGHPPQSPPQRPPPIVSRREDERRELIRQRRLARRRQAAAERMGLPGECRRAIDINRPNDGLGPAGKRAKERLHEQGVLDPTIEDVIRVADEMDREKAEIQRMELAEIHRQRRRQQSHAHDWFAMPDTSTPLEPSSVENRSSGS